MTPHFISKVRAHLLRLICDNNSSYELKELIDATDKFETVVRKYESAITAEVTAAVPEPATSSIKVLSWGENKIQAIKAVRENTGVGLKEAKDVVEGFYNNTPLFRITRKHANELAQLIMSASPGASVVVV